MSDRQCDRISRMLTYIKDKRYYRRNAAVAMGNLGDDSFIPNLSEAMNDPFEIVRGHAAWALGKIGGLEAKKVLATHLNAEKTGYVVREITRALSEKDPVPGDVLS